MTTPTRFARRPPRGLAGSLRSGRALAGCSRGKPRGVRAVNSWLSTWAVNVGDNPGLFSVTGLPASVSVGDSGTASAQWGPVADGLHFLGATRYLQGATVVGDTAIDVSPGAPIALSTSGIEARKARSGH